jgi:hypothetical protein
MLSRKLRSALEWHFYNYIADKRLSDEKVSEIAERGMIANLSRVGGSSHIGNPTEAKAIKLEMIESDRTWAAVVENTFLTFKFKPEHDIMVALYIDNKPRAEIIDEYFMSGKWQTSFWRWREMWLECAYDWAKEFGLL